jgi:hypothetical protein
MAELDDCAACNQCEITEFIRMEEMKRRIAFCKECIQGNFSGGSDEFQLSVGEAT